MIKAIQLILSLSFLVVIHELGHFTFARIFKVRVEKFYMFFNPRFSLLRAKKINGKWQIRFFAPNVESNMTEKIDEFGQVEKDAKGKSILRPMTEDELAKLPDNDWRKYPETTEWGIGWLPFGGYCAIAGMVDETTSSNQLAAEAKPWEFRAQALWKRLFIIIGGVLVNFIAALIMYGAILFNWGEEYLPIQNATYGMQYAEMLQEQGLQNGDKIIAINGEMPLTRSEVVEWILVDDKHNITVARGLDTLTIRLSDDIAAKALASGTKSFIDFRFPFVVHSLVENGAAAGALMMPGDSVIAVNGVAAYTFQDVTAELEKYPCQNITLTFVRNGEIMEQSMFIGDECKIGVYRMAPSTFLQVETKEYSFLESIPAGIQYGWNTLVSYVKQLKLVFSKEGAKQLGGFGTIGSLFPSTWNWQAFWMMTAFLSIILAFMNIIPIPGLDGGYVLMILFEMITRKKPSDKFLEIANNIGFWLLLALLIYANANDVIRFL